MNLPAATPSIQALHGAIQVETRSRALFLSIRNKGSIFLPCGQECDLSNWALSLSSGSFILSVVKSKGGERVVEIWPIFSERQKGNLGQRKLFNFFGLLKLLTGEQTDVTTYHQLHAIKYIACLCRCPESFLFIHSTTV